jgi:hypothetical protein
MDQFDMGNYHFSSVALTALAWLAWESRYDHGGRNSG